MTPPKILEQARKLISEHANGDPDKWWYANRFVFARLQLDERKTKTSIKRDLFEANKPCHYCGKDFETKRNVHLHRLDGNQGYRDENCVLMHQDCHYKWHAEHQDDHAMGPVGRPPADRIVDRLPANPVKQSRRYDDKPFLYWWDITPMQVSGIKDMEAIEFVKKDTGERCVVPAETMRRFLTQDRQTSRSQGNWGVKVLKDRPDALAFEPGKDTDKWLILPVVWINEQEED